MSVEETRQAVENLTEPLDAIASLAADECLHRAAKRIERAPTSRATNMTSLADLLDPDQWIASGRNLTDFPWPDGNNERETMKLILSTKPALNARVDRWSKLVMDAFGRRGGEKVGDVFMEEYLRELWDRARAPS